MKIGIIGSGITGLVSAWLFGADGHEVVIYDRRGIGLERHGYRFECRDKSVHLDVPSRLMNPRQWPTYLKLLEIIGAELVEVNSTQSFSSPVQGTYLNTNLSSTWNINPIQFANRYTRTIAREAKRLFRNGNQDLAAGISDEICFSDYLSSDRYSRMFQFGFLYPALSSTVCTCSYEALDSYPAKIMLGVLSNLTKKDNSGLLKTKLGMPDLVRRLLVHRPRIQSPVDVSSMVACADHVEVKFRHQSMDQAGQTESQTSPRESSERVDHLIVATQANQARRLFQSPTMIESEMLDCFDYEDVGISLHQDLRLMPADQSSWATFNMITGDSRLDRSPAMCSIWMNRFDSACKTRADIFQTINPFVEARRETVLYECNLQRPVVNQNSIRGWDLLDKINAQHDRRIWFAGSYAGRGVPLLETGVVSALQVAESIGIKTPFSKPGLAMAN